MIHLYTCITKIEYIITKEPNQTRIVDGLFSVLGPKKCNDEKEHYESQKGFVE
jgi:hypothetical protein